MPAARPPTANRVYEALIRDCPGLRTRVAPVQLAAGTEIYAVGERLTHVYFPTSGVLSVAVQLRDGGTADALTIGREGFLGLSTWFGLKQSPECVVQQVAGESQRIPAAAFCDAIDGSAKARRLFKHFAAYSLRAGYQSAVCNAHHELDPRLCRWLLTSADRAGSDTLTLSQALLAQMLGVRRQSVSVAVGHLQRAGLIDARRTVVRIVDRRGLERRACECYDETTRLYARLVEPQL